MSKRTELVGMKRALIVPGVRPLRTGLMFEREVDAEMLEELGATLQAIDVCRAWWWGDFLAAYCGYNLKGDEKDQGYAFDAITQGEKRAHYTARYSTICDKEPKTLMHWRGCADFYTISRRREELIWTHHIEAKDASGGDTAVADNWLDQAVKHNWTIEKLRKAISNAKQVGTKHTEPEPQMVLPMELVAARRYVSTAIKRVDTMDIAEAEAQLAYLQPVLAYATALMHRAQATPGGKESLSRAA